MPRTGEYYIVKGEDVMLRFSFRDDDGGCHIEAVDSNGGCARGALASWSGRYPSTLLKKEIKEGKAAIETMKEVIDRLQKDLDKAAGKEAREDAGNSE